MVCHVGLHVNDRGILALWRKGRSVSSIFRKFCGDFVNKLKRIQLLRISFVEVLCGTMILLDKQNHALLKHASLQVRKIHNNAPPSVGKAMTNRNRV